MVREHLGDYPTLRAAIQSIAAKIGCTTETLDNWMKQDERDVGGRGGLRSDQRTRMKALERENVNCARRTRFCARRLRFSPRRSEPKDFRRR